jgi:D-psicose/D-tagatose/L-ribulose 3-epimerase
MNFGVSIWLWTSPVTNEVLETYIPKIAKLGFDVVEIPLEEPDTLDCKRARRVIEDHELKVTACAAMGPGRDLIHPDERIRESTMEYMKTSIQASNELGSEVFAGPVYAEVGRLWQMNEAERKTDVNKFADQLKVLSDYAEDRDVTICVEALNRFETSFLNLTSQVSEVIEKVDHPNCKILIDLFHAGIEEKDLGEAIRTAGKHLGHLQIAENDRGTPGTGQFDWEGISGALNDIRYDKNIIIETFSPGNEMLAKAAAIWRPLAESPDQLAEDGLDFMKKIFKKA